MTHTGMPAVPCVVFLAVGLVLSVPWQSRADVLLVRNESRSPVVVQAAGVVRGVLQRGRPVMLQSGQVAPAIMIPGNKILTVYEATPPNRVIFQAVIPGGMADRYYGIVPDMPPPKVRLAPRSAFR